MILNIKEDINQIFLIKNWNNDIQKNKTKIINRMQNRIKNLINTWPTILLCYIVSHDKQMNKTKKLKNIKIREKVRHS